MDIERMNGTDLHTLELQKGDSLQIRFETEEGSLYMEIKAPDGAAIYRGNGKETTDFTVNIPESGANLIRKLGIRCIYMPIVALRCDLSNWWIGKTHRLFAWI